MMQFGGLGRFEWKSTSVPARDEQGSRESLRDVFGEFLLRLMSSGSSDFRSGSGGCGCRDVYVDFMGNRPLSGENLDEIR